MHTTNLIPASTIAAYNQIIQERFPTVRVIVDPLLGGLEEGRLAAICIPENERLSFLKFVLHELPRKLTARCIVPVPMYRYSEDETKAAYPEQLSYTSNQPSQDLSMSMYEVDNADQQLSIFGDSIWSTALVSQQSMFPQQACAEPYDSADDSASMSMIIQATLAHQELLSFQHEATTHVNAA